VAQLVEQLRLVKSSPAWSLLKKKKKIVPYLDYFFLRYLFIYLESTGEGMHRGRERIPGRLHAEYNTGLYLRTLRSRLSRNQESGPQPTEPARHPLYLDYS